MLRRYLKIFVVCLLIGCLLRDSAVRMLVTVYCSLNDAVFRPTRCDNARLVQRDFRFPVRFLATPTPCPDAASPSVLYAVFVLVAVTDFDRRQLIRTTWAKRFKQDSRNVKFLFVVGNGPLNDSAATRLQREVQVEEDVLQSDVVEHYYNLTMKTYAALKWIHSQCPGAKYVVRADSDIVLAKRSLDHFLRTDGLHLSHSIVGHCHRLHCPTRQPSVKNCIPFESFPGGLLPSYCFGFSYVISADLLDRMLRTWQSLPYFHLEDVFLSGILADAVGDVQRVDRRDLFDYQTPFDSFRCDSMQIASASHRSVDEQRRKWTAYTDNCRRTPALLP